MAGCNLFNVEQFGLLLINLTERVQCFVTAYPENAGQVRDEARHNCVLESVITKECGSEPVATAVVSLENMDKKAVCKLRKAYP